MRAPPMNSSIEAGNDRKKMQKGKQGRQVFSWQTITLTHTTVSAVRSVENNKRICLYDALGSSNRCPHFASIYTLIERWPALSSEPAMRVTVGHLRMSDVTLFSTGCRCSSLPTTQVCPGRVCSQCLQIWTSRSGLTWKRASRLSSSICRSMSFPASLVRVITTCV